MKKTKRLTFIALALMVCVGLASLAFGQAMPKPGEVIDKNNYKQYAHLFPPEFVAGFENGFGGLYKPWVVKVGEPKPTFQPKGMIALSEKNRGKYSIDKDGFIVGGYDYVGNPFPGVTKDDKDFATKFMYNYAYRYQWEDMVGTGYDIEKRKGENVTNVMFDTSLVFFINRLADDPKPTYKTPSNYLTAQTFYWTYPNSFRNQQMLSIRYLDPKRADETYMYLPTMRRVLRMEAAQRSTPIQGTTQALDDFNIIDIKTQEFTFNFLGEKTVLACPNTTITTPVLKKMQAESGGYLPFPGDNWSLHDVYVIEAKSKDPKYPQKTKVVYVDKESLQAYYGVATDRGGKLWKVWILLCKESALPSGDKFFQGAFPIGIDVQIGFATSFLVEGKPWGTGLKYGDMLPDAMVKRGR